MYYSSDMKTQKLLITYFIKSLEQYIHDTMQTEQYNHN